MGKHETIVPMRPPASSIPAVKARRLALELERDALRAGAVVFAVDSALVGDLDARNRLAAIPAKLAALQFEIDLNHEAQQLAHETDVARETAWRAAVQSLEPKEILAGIGKDSCCARCTPGSPGGCVLTAGAPFSGSTCSHPVKERHQFQLNEIGKRIFPYRHSPQASRIFDAACEQLKVRGEFV
jgi:hypothetical protein